MTPDGQFGFNLGVVGNYQRYAVWFQATPWLETSFRYSRVPWAGGNRVYYDRSFGARIRLLNEINDFADVSIGVRDLLGTGVYASEYLVASKRLGNVDLTAGLGWGRLSEDHTIPNPIGTVLNTFNSRPDVGQNSGSFDFGALFRGPKAGLFGGVAWHTPVDGITLLAEYSSDEYSHEAAFPHGLKVRSPANVGISYQLLPSFSLSAGWYYGTTYGLNLTLSADPTASYPSALRIGPKMPAPALRSDNQQMHATGNLRAITRENHQSLSHDVWVKVASPAEEARQNILQAFMSETRGVRNVTIEGKSLVVDAHMIGDPEKQCANYSRIAATSNQNGVTEVALTDLENSIGAVTFCAADSVTAKGHPLLPLVGRQTDNALQNRIGNDVRGQDIVFSGLWVQGSEIWVYFENYRYRNASDAAGRIARVLMADAPPDIEIFHLVPSVLGVPQQEIRISRSGLERDLGSYDPVTVLGDTVSVDAPPMRNPGLEAFASELYPKFSYGVSPKLTQHVFDPDHPIQFLVYADAPALLQLMPGLDIEAHATAQIWSDYTFTRDAGSALPHVRSDVLKYLNYGKYGISSLDMAYTTKLAPEVYTQVRAGYLEDMFFGAGGQILWRPEQSRFTFGADAYQVWQREFHRLFSLQHYNVLTGHVSMYYRSSWHDLNYAVHVGRYLAGDYGGTFEITRRFDSGVEIGAWATFTNVPFKKFGEGSFDKGIIIHIPFEWGLPIWSQSSYDLHLSSLTRDGGQRLGGDDSLYALTNGSSYGEITDHLGDIVEP